MNAVVMYCIRYRQIIAIIIQSHDLYCKSYCLLLLFLIVRMGRCLDYECVLQYSLICKRCMQLQTARYKDSEKPLSVL